MGAATLDPVLEVQTKTRGGTLNLAMDAARVDFEQSKRRLRRSAFDSFLIHSVDQLLPKAAGPLVWSGITPLAAAPYIK